MRSRAEQAKIKAKISKQYDKYTATQTQPRGDVDLIHDIPPGCDFETNRMKSRGIVKKGEKFKKTYGR